MNSKVVMKENVRSFIINEFFYDEYKYSIYKFLTLFPHINLMRPQPLHRNSRLSISSPSLQLLCRSSTVKICYFGIFTNRNERILFEVSFCHCQPLFGSCFRPPAFLHTRTSFKVAKGICFVDKCPVGTEVYTAYLYAGGITARGVSFHF